MTSPDPFPSGRRIRTVSVGRKVTGAVPSLSCPASQIPQCCYNIRDPDHIHCGKAAGVAVVLDIIIGPAKIVPVVLPTPAGGVVVADVWSSIYGAVAFGGPYGLGSCMQNHQW